MSLTSRLRQRVDIQEKVQTQNPTTGEVLHSWQNVWLDSDTELAGVPAEVLTGAGREYIAADARLAETSARITMRWFPGLSAAWRILWDGRIYDITSSETDITGRREWRLRCIDGASDG